MARTVAFTPLFLQTERVVQISRHVNVARPDSRASSVAPLAGSTTELCSVHDLYAVSPLPHLNQNMPYWDDPSQMYYDHDSYTQAVPPAAEAYATTQITPGTQATYGYDPRAMSPAYQQLLVSTTAHVVPDWLRHSTQVVYRQCLRLARSQGQGGVAGPSHWDWV
ncbi:hypothetical protein C8Q74DRAFT_1371387 [Fomes fomentarius]|nr:hypothetical protein C8Q74DRAFT_1371387 [Fomes fomentarius]